MSHVLISVTDEELQNKTPIAAFNEKLRRVIPDQVQIVAIFLHPELGCGTEMLEWLESWQDKFLKVKKQFFIVPGNVNQLECLEVSHPDQELKYVPTVDDLETLLASLAPEVSEAVLEIQMPSPAQAPPPAPLQQKIRTEPAQSEHVDAEPATFEVKIAKPVADSASPPVLMDVSQIVELSGEYKCRGCGVARMWLKGDIAADCTNPECTDTDSGWEMTYELF